MISYVAILGGLWVVFIAVWIVGMFTAKRTVRRSWSGIWWRVGIIATVLLLFRYHVIQSTSYLTGVVPIPVLNIAGLVLTALGIALAVWARFYLGRNWGMPLSVREHPELVTTGPYAYIRHPIYAGILLALLGSGLVLWWWFIIFVWSLVYFAAFALRGEEELMNKEFPDTYPAYKARTKRLIPRVY